MEESSITICGLGKKYLIRHRARQRYETLRELWARQAGRLLGGARDGVERSREEFWALQDVSFQIGVGERVGIIGRNGAGKSTLLKIISRITKPSSGYLEVKGRIASLLEVGTGFHPELTGRENIYLNGAVLGMRRREIDRKFDEIVAFAEVERFLDTPVKRYSSGMYVRLAFAVAAHLEPDIMLVDEVLAVGDVAFQRKCLGRMDQVAKQEGRTILFVSHNMGAIKALCSRAIEVRDGRIVKDGAANAVVNHYLADCIGDSADEIIPDNAIREGSGEARFRRVRLLDDEGRPTRRLYYKTTPIRVEVDVEAREPVRDVWWELAVATLDGVQLTFSSSLEETGRCESVPAGRCTLTAELATSLVPGDYTFVLGLHHSGGATVDYLLRTVSFTVLRTAKWEDAKAQYTLAAPRGFVNPSFRYGIRGEGEGDVSAHGASTHA